jgi:hypothetical protein
VYGAAMISYGAVLLLNGDMAALLRSQIADGEPQLGLQILDE